MNTLRRFMVCGLITLALIILCVTVSTAEGVITILPCFCGIKGDLNDDGACNPLDMVYMIHHVYLSVDNFVHPEGWDCPYELGDTDCSGIIDPLDVVYLLRLIYRGSDVMCEPCSMNPNPVAVRRARDNL